MIHSYSDFINEGSSSSKSPIYWNYDLVQLLEKNWSEISTTKYDSNIYYINFKAGEDKEDKYDFFSVLVQNKTSDDVYMMDNSKPFIEKFKKEFWKNPNQYVKSLKYKPKCLGDLSHVELSDKYNM